MHDNLENIKIETNGLILNGEFKDWHIFIKDIDNGQGAYLILLNSPNNSQGFDDWVENFQNLEDYFSEVNWNVVWSK